MTERLRVKIEKIKEYHKTLKDMGQDCEEKFLKDIVYRGALLHYLYLIADSCITLAELIIRDRNLRTPQTYQDTIDILGENNIIPASFAYEFAKIASFRNFLAHDYEKIDYLKICRDALRNLADIETYIKYIEQNYQGRG
ncbi:MAG: DUF86 domain-containing protein [Nitrospirae bacterium]|nr:DUF86 domain-containing protein [Nitrospirota bacterium]